MLLPESSCVYIPSFRSVAPRIFPAKIPFLAFSRYSGNHFPDFSAYFKLGQNLSSFQLSEKATHRFSQNDSTNTHTQADGQTDIQTHPLIYIYIYRILAAYTRRCPANVNTKHYRSHSNFGLVAPLISSGLPKQFPVLFGRYNDVLWVWPGQNYTQ